jgi:hypothetical protein
MNCFEIRAREQRARICSRKLQALKKAPRR